RAIEVAVLRCCTHNRGPGATITPGPLTCVGVAGFEPTTSSSRTKRAAKLRYTPSVVAVAATTFTLAHGWPETKSGFSAGGGPGSGGRGRGPLGGPPGRRRRGPPGGRWPARCGSRRG